MMHTGLWWNQVRSDRIDVTWSLSKEPKSQFAALYNSNGARVDTFNMGGDVREVQVTLPEVQIEHTVTITAYYKDNTLGTEAVKIKQSY